MLLLLDQIEIKALLMDVDGDDDHHHNNNNNQHPRQVVLKALTDKTENVAWCVIIVDFIVSSSRIISILALMPSVVHFKMGSTNRHHSSIV